MNYRPLPPYLTIAKSSIEGLGLFATDNIDDDFIIGVTHVRDDSFDDGYQRTPLGGFFNHSDEPNCKVIYDDRYIKIQTIRAIKAGEELTATYTFYKPKQ